MPDLKGDLPTDLPDNRDLAAFLAARPEVRGQLHRYLARMTGSVIDAEDVLQDAFLAAARALDREVEIEDMRAWLFRIAHNTALNAFRGSKREAAMRDQLGQSPAAPPVSAAPQQAEMSDALTPYLALTPIQRSIVIFRDVLGYSAAETADLTKTSVASVKSALHRGRAVLTAARAGETPERAALPAAQVTLLTRYAALFNAHDFDAIRDMLSAEVRLDLVAVERRQGKGPVSGYFSNYAKRTDWRMAPGMVEGRPAILAFDRDEPAGPPVYFVLLSSDEAGVNAIRDFRYARYAMSDADWVVL